MANQLDYPFNEKFDESCQYFVALPPGQMNLTDDCFDEPTENDA